MKRVVSVILGALMVAVTPGHLVSASPGTSVYDVVSAGRSTTKTLIDASGVADALDDCGEDGSNSGLPNFTLFFPATDEIFDEALVSLDMTLEEIVAQPALVKQILLYHVSRGSISPSQFTRPELVTVWTLSGLTLAKTVGPTEDGDTEVEVGEYFVNGYAVLSDPAPACNGWVYVINGLLAPSTAFDTIGVSPDPSGSDPGGTTPGSGGSTPGTEDPDENDDTARPGWSFDRELVPMPSSQPLPVPTPSGGSLPGTTGVVPTGPLISSGATSPASAWSLPATGADSRRLARTALLVMSMGAGLLVIRRRSIA